MKHLETILVSTVMVSAAGGCFGQARNPCFAFLLKGDVTVACHSENKQITHRADIESFAVSNEQSSFAYTTSRTVKRTGAVESAVSTTTLIDLRKSSSKVFGGVTGVVGTCGGLFPANARPGPSSLRDLATGAELAIQPYARFRCSSNRATVVGTTGDAGDLYEGLPPAVKIAAESTFNMRGFGISPDGRKIVYRDDHGRLCLFTGSVAAQCIEKQGTLTDIPSVDNSGEVLIAVGTGQECFYNGSYNFSPRRFLGATDESRDECLGIGYWRPGLQSVEIIQPLGRNPQWISVATAELLRNWSGSQQDANRAK